MVDLNGGPVHIAPILREGIDFCYLSVDNLVFIVHEDGGCSLMNPLSGLTLPLPKLANVMRQELSRSIFYSRSDVKKTHLKAVMSSPLHSTSDPLVAVLIMEGKGVAVSGCQPHHDAIIINISSSERLNNRIDDIAFLHGKLSALNMNEGLYVAEFDAGHLSMQELPSGFNRCIAEDPKQQQIYDYGTITDDGYLVLRYLAECSGRLLMMRRWMSLPRGARLGDHDRTVKFEVF
jgi:hypothetical protein